MNSFNHLSIARVLQQVIEEELPIKLDTLAFRYGSIKPDISPALIKIPHFIGDAIGFIKLQIEQLIYLKNNTLTGGAKQFSEQLGIITHYLSDFFCYVHSVHYKGGDIGHYLYEISLGKYFRKHLRLPEPYESLRLSKICPDYESICRYIDELQDEYIKKSPSYAVDMNYSFRICLSVCMSIILICTAPKLETAA